MIYDLVSTNESTILQAIDETQLWLEIFLEC